MSVKTYGIHDKWTDLDKLNNVNVKSVDGVIESVKINGEEAGGGGIGAYPILTAAFNSDSGTYTYSCDWSFTELKAKIEEQSLNPAWASIYIEDDMDGTDGGTWFVYDINLRFRKADGSYFDYYNDGTISKIN